MTDPTPQAGRAQGWCSSCDKMHDTEDFTGDCPICGDTLIFAVRHTLGEDCPWCPAKAGETCLRFDYDHPGHPRERGSDAAPLPSPAPPAEREWLVVDSMPEAMKILADKLKQAESALTAMREEAHTLYTQWQAMSLTVERMREERDRAQAALTPEEITILGNMLSVMGEWGMFNLPQLHAIAGAVHRILKGRAALKPVSDRQPEGETK